MDKYVIEEEGMDMDGVDGGVVGDDIDAGHKGDKRNGECSTNVVNSAYSTQNGNTGETTLVPGVDTVGSGGDMTDMVSPLVLAAMALHRPQQERQSHSMTPTESSDSKKIWDALKRRLSSRPGEGDDGPFSSCDPHDFFYNMNHKNRGKAIIFNHEKFDPNQGLQPRPGTNKDAADVKCTLERLGFSVEIYNDLKFEKLHGVLEKEALFNHKDDDCIAVVVLTHGGQDYLNAYDFPYKPDSLWSMFSADKCPSLAGKPKMFFIQACRGETYDEGTMLLSRNKSRTVVDGPEEGRTYKIPNQSDFLMVFSTAPACEMTNSDNRTFVSRLFQFLSLSNSGHFSWRNSMKGGCFIQALCRIFDKYAWDMDMLSLTTLVNKEVAINYESNVPRDVTQHQKKQIPHVSHTLTRQIQLFPKGVHSTLV